MKNKPFFPMFIDLSDKNIVVVGGGKIATRRVKTLLSFTRNIRVIAPKVTREMMELAKTGYVELLTRPVRSFGRRQQSYPTGIFGAVL